MRYSSQIRPISYLKSNAAEVLDKLAETREPRGHPGRRVV